MRAREDPDHARVVRHRTRGRNVGRGQTFALADARPVREAHGVRRTGKNHVYIFLIINPNPRRLDVVLTGTSNPQRPNRRNDDAANPNLTENACKCMHFRPRSFVT